MAGGRTTEGGNTEAGLAARPPAPGQHRWRFLPVAALLALALFGYLQGWHEQLTLAALIRQREALAALIASHRATAMLGFVALYAAAVAVSIPGAALFTIAGGLLFGWLVGAALASAGAMLGATAVFLAARTALGRLIAARAGRRLAQLAMGFRADAFHYLLFLRLVPLFPFWLVNLAPALFDVPLSIFVAATAIGILPGTIAFAVIGSGLDSVIAAQEAAHPGCAEAGTCRIEISALVTTELLVALVMLGLVALLPVAVKAWRRRRGGPGR